MSHNSRSLEQLEQENSYLSDRISYVEKVNFWYRDALAMLSRLGETNQVQSNEQTPNNIINLIQSYLAQLVDFEVRAFYLVNEDDSSFDLADCNVPRSVFDISALKNQLIKEGEFAWALAQNRPVIVDKDKFGRNILLHVLTTKSRIRGMFIGVSAKGDELPLEAAQSLLTVIFQNTAYAIESMALYSMVRNYNKELKRANDYLECQVKERTKQLSKLVEEADQANQFKSQFLANMSHEIRTPMNAVINLSHLALEGELSNEQRDYLEKIEKSGQNLLVIINDILDYSKMEAGKLDIEAITFNLNDLLTELYDMFNFQVQEKNLRLFFYVDEQPKTQVIGDPTRIKQVLINLINNAIKFTPEGGEITVTVEQKLTGDHGANVTFAVKDTGIGISQEHQAQLFESFNQADSSTTRKYGGTGLGLAICKQLVMLMGGDIQLQSEKDAGTTFSFTLPLMLDNSKPSSAGKIETKQKNLKGMVILLAEDNEINQIIATKLLQVNGCEIVIANNGLEALQQVEAFPEKFDLVLMDIQMPVMDGFEATEKIRALKNGQDLPILAMTADAMGNIKERCLAIGMNDYISKPFKVDELLQTLSHWYKHQPISSDSNTSEQLTNHTSSLNVKAALDRLMDDMELYLMLLTMFKNENSKMYYDINTALAEDNYDLAKDLLHGFKGVAGNIGADELYEVITNIETDLKNTQYHIDDSLRVFKLKFENTMKAIDEVLDQNEP